MKVLLILATFVTACCSWPIVKTWTLNELSNALTGANQNDGVMQPFLEDALNQIMYGLYTGQEKDVMALIPSPTGDRTWTMDQLKKAIHDPDTDPNNGNFIRAALQTLEYIKADGKDQDSIEVTVPALDISVWTICDVEEAKHNPNTKAELLTYLEKAEHQIEEALKLGTKREDVRATLVTPVGLVPVYGETRPKLIPRTS